MQETLGFHLLISLAAPALVWFLFAKPLMTIGPKKSLGLMGLTVFVWCILFPVIMITTGSTKLSISGETDFVVVKLLSVAFIMLVFQGFIVASYYKKHINSKTMTWVIGGLFMINILEACYTQFNNYLEPQATSKHVIDVLNPIIGLGLVGIVIATYLHRRIEIVRPDKKQIRLDAKLGTWFIISYTIWNLLFRSRLIENTSSLIFATLSLGLPLICHFTKTGDWLQIRGVGLLSLMIFTFGLTPAMQNFNLLPVYNKDGYDKPSDNESIISKAQSNDVYRWGMFIAALGTLVMAGKELHLFGMK